MGNIINFPIKVTVRSGNSCNSDNSSNSGPSTEGIILRCNGKKGQIQNGIATFTFQVEEDTSATYKFTLDPKHTEWEINKGCGTSAPLLSASSTEKEINLTLKKINYIKSFKIKNSKQEQGQEQIIEVREELPSPPIYTTKHSLQSLNHQVHPEEIFYLEAETSFDFSDVKWAYYLKGINEDLKKEEDIRRTGVLSIEGITPEGSQRTIQTAKVNLGGDEGILKKHIDTITRLSNQSQPIDFHIVFFAYLKNPAYNNDQHIQTHLILRVSEIPLLSFYKEGGEVKLRVDYQQKREEVKIAKTLPSPSDNHKVLDLGGVNSLTGLNLKSNSGLPTYGYEGNFKIRIYPEITLEMLQKVFGLGRTDSSKDAYLKPIVRILNEIKDGEPAYVKYHLDTEERLAHFFAQCYVEVGGAGFKLEEDLTYGVDDLYKTFGDSFTKMGDGRNYENIKKAFEVAALHLKGTKRTTKTLREVQSKYPSKEGEIRCIISNRGEGNSEVNEEGIANLVYWDENRIEGNRLGNEEEGDGYKFIGRGMKQLTGRYNYQKLENWLRNNDLLKRGDSIRGDSIMDNPESLADTSKDYFFLSAVYFWNANSIYLEAKPDNVDRVTAIINPAKKGLDERKMTYIKIQYSNLADKFKEIEKQNSKKTPSEKLTLYRQAINANGTEEEERKGIFEDFRK